MQPHDLLYSIRSLVIPFKIDLIALPYPCTTTSLSKNPQTMNHHSLQAVSISNIMNIS